MKQTMKDGCRDAAGGGGDRYSIGDGRSTEKVFKGGGAAPDEAGGGAERYYIGDGWSTKVKGGSRHQKSRKKQEKAQEELKGQESVVTAACGEGQLAKFFSTASELVDRGLLGPACLADLLQQMEAKGEALDTIQKAGKEQEKKSAEEVGDS